MLQWSFEQFCTTDLQAAGNQLVTQSVRSGFSTVQDRQIDAWAEQLRILQETAKSITRMNPSAARWQLVLEYAIPRRGKYVDAVVVTPACICVLEFKVHATEYARAAEQQVEDYALDLEAFHEGSQGTLLAPILVATAAPQAARPEPIAAAVQPVTWSNSKTLTNAIQAWAQVEALPHSPTINVTDWATAPYRPTPTIVEAAQRLFADQGVEDLTRMDAGARNLRETQKAIERAADHAAKTGRKVACFVTGVPGSGKTLAGLKLATTLGKSDGRAVYLSGNGPLVKVLIEALARDRRQTGGVAMNDARREAGQFIQNVHRFIDAMADRERQPPHDHVVVFDEAQRAWDLQQSKRKFNRSASEPHTMLEILDRGEDRWALLVCLVGNGQEINTGEAGLREWGRSLEEDFRHWDVFVAPDLLCASEETKNALFVGPTYHSRAAADSGLHLNTSLRSYRAARLAAWVDALLDGDLKEAMRHRLDPARYEVRLTRSLEHARNWLRDRCRGKRRPGLLASSGARRLRPFGIDVGSRVEVEHWLLNDAPDVRSSHALEQAATEFDIQGLELDWAGVCWGLDLRWGESGWGMRRFKGTAWQTIRKAVDMEFVRNKYRVLLTRAREGMVLWVPEGIDTDATAATVDFDAIAAALLDAGVQPLD